MLKLSRCALLACMVGVLPSLVGAQAEDSVGKAADSVSRTDSAVPVARNSAQTRLAPVTVSATRGHESSFAAPLAVSVVRRVELADKRGYSLDEALENVPGVVAQSRYGTSDVRIAIRGFGARGAGDRSNAGTTRGVRILVDGIPETEPDGRTSFDLIDLAVAERVEVIRSNASAIWGNAAGGVIAVSTIPEVDSHFKSIQQIGGSFGLLRTAVRAGGPLGAAKWATAFTNTSQQGWREHSDARRVLLSTSLFAPLGDGGGIGVYLTGANDLFHIPGPLTPEQAASSPRSANAVYQSRDERRYNRLGRIGVTLRHDVGTGSVSGMFFLSPKVLQRSERNTFRDFTRLHLGGNLLYSGSAKLTERLRGNTIIGVDHAHQSGAVLFYSLGAGGTRGDELRENQNEGSVNFGAFVQQQLAVGQRINLEAGARYDVIRYDYRNFLRPGVDAEKSFARMTPKIGVSYQPGALHTLYASVGGGVEAPAGNETEPASTFGQDTVTALNPLLEPIHSTTYEIGTRQIVPLRLSGAVESFSYDAAAYWTEVTNEIVPYRGGRFYFTAGKVRRRGAEIGARVSGASALEVRGTLSLSRNEYVQYTVDSVHYGRPGAFADYAGNRQAGIPPVVFSASISREVIPRVPVSVKVNWKGAGSYFTDDANVVSVPAYSVFGATLSTSRAIRFSRTLALAGFATVENLTNRRFIGSAFINPDVVDGQPVAFEPGQPRGFVIGVTLLTATREHPE